MRLKKVLKEMNPTRFPHKEKKTKNAVACSDKCEIYWFLFICYNLLPLYANSDALAFFTLDEEMN